MKNILGSLVVLLFSILHANEFAEYSIQADKTDVVINEAVYVVFEVRQKLHDEVMFFDLEPKPSDMYDVILIQKKRFEYNYHDATKKFEYLVLPKKEGTVQPTFHFHIRRATDDAVAQTYVGSRDNVKYIPTTKVDIGDVKVTLHVRQLPTHVDGVGDFKLSIDIDKKEVTAFDAVNVVYRLEGSGYLDEKYEPLKTIEGVSIFRGVKNLEKRVTAKGYKYIKEYSYALVAQKDFTIPKTSISFYDPKVQKSVTQTIQPQEIQVKQIDVATLVDTEEFPKKEGGYYLYYFINSFYYVLAFVAGFFAREFYQKYLKRPEKVTQVQKYPSIKNAKRPQELLQAVLSVKDQVDLADEIELLEAVVYKGAKVHSFEKLKRKIVQKLD